MVGSTRRSRICVSGVPNVSESFRSMQEMVGCASESSSAARVTLPKRTQASKAIICGSSPCRK